MRRWVCLAAVVLLPLVVVAGVSAGIWPLVTVAATGYLVALVAADRQGVAW